MSKMQKYLDKTKSMMILFDKKDFDKFINDYSEDLSESGVMVHDTFDNKINKIVVTLSGNTSFLFNKNFTYDVETHYNGAIA